MASEPPSILVVDDNPDICELLQLTLERAGYAVTCQTRGELALVAARSRRPDMAIIDILMPRINGLVVADQLVSAGVPVLLMTGSPDRREMIAQSGYPFLLKPFRMSELLESVERLAKRRRAAASPLS
jgi:DNA-binding response OmpR family regulator